MSGEVRRVMDAGAAAAGMMAQPPPPPPPPDMDSGYPDSVGSSPRSSRDNDTDFNRWDAAAGGGAGAGAGDGNRVRLMCSFGGRIMPRPHDNQLTYAGGETRILAVDRNIRYNVIMARLAAFTGVPVSFKYQLPTEDLDALVSVTNDEDLDNMMAEYDRLCKHGGFRFSRLRLFLFRATGADAGASSDEAGKKDGWFVDALNAGVSRSESGGGAGSENSAWSNNIPDYLFGLEGKSAADEADLAGNEGGSVRSSSSRISEPDVPERRRREPEEPVAPPPQPHVHQHQHQHQLQHQHQHQQHHQQQQQQQPVPVQEFQRLQIRQQQQHQQQQQQPHQAPPPQQVPQPVKVMNPEPVYSAASSAPTVADYGNVPEPPAPAPVAPQQQFVTPQQPVTYWDPHTHQQVYVVHAPVPTPVQQRAPQPAVAPVPTQVAAPYYVARSPAVNVYGGGERPAPVVQRQPVAPTSAELTEAYREPPPPAKVPAPVYAQGPVAGGVIYRPAHTEGGQYVYHHGGMVYEAPAGVGGAPRPVFYTQSGTPVMGNVGVAATAVPVTYSSAPSDMGPTRATQSS